MIGGSGGGQSHKPNARESTKPVRARERRGATADRRRGPVTCTVDVGGSHIKAARVDAYGRLLGRRHKLETPDPMTPDSLLAVIAAIGARLQPFDRATIGINGLVHRGTVYAVPITGDDSFRGFDLAARLSQRWERPVCLLNDAVMHGLGVIRGRGVELVITLGTGLGTAVFIDGTVGPQPQFTPAPSRHEPRGGAYGDEAMIELGRRRWSRRVARLIDTLRVLTNFEHLYVGGGNAKRLDCELPRDATRVDNHGALLGGVRAWMLDPQP